MAGSWSNNATTSLTLPTGATNPQQRITLDGTSDTILVYSGTGALIASIAASAGADGFGHSYPAGISSTGGVISQSIILVYSGTPATGTLTTSIASAAGSDSFGNSYVAGVGSYNNAQQSFASLNGGVLEFGPIVAGVPDTSDASFIFGAANGELAFSSGKQAAPTNDSCEIQLFAGQPGQTTGSLACPQIFIDDLNLTSDVDVYLSGSLIKMTAAGNPDTWQTPSYNPNWGASSTFNGSTNWGPVNYRREPFDQVWIGGAFKAGGTLPGAAVFQLPSIYRPKQQWPLAALHNHGGTVTSCFLAVTTAGNVDVITATGGSIATGDEFLIAPQHFPLGNIA